MSLSVSSFPEAHSRLTTNPTWGEGTSPITKRWFFGGRLNTGSVSFMKGIRHIGKVQLKSSVTRRAPKSQPQNTSPPLPPRFSVRASTIVIDIIAVPHDDGRQSSTDISHDTSIPDPIPWPRWRAVPLLQPLTRVDSEGAVAACKGPISPSWQPDTEEIGLVSDLPIVVLTPADGSDMTRILLGGNSNLLRREIKTSIRKRSLSSPSGKHVGSRTRDLAAPAPPSPPPLLSMDIARLRSGSRPTPTPLLVTTERRPKTAPTTRATKPVAQATTPVLLHRRPTGPRSTRDGDGNGSLSNISRSRSQPQLRTAEAVTGAARNGTAEAADEQPMPSRYRTGSPPDPFAIYVKTPEVLQEAPAVRASPQGGEQRPRIAYEIGNAARPLALVDGTDPGAAWETHKMGVAASRLRTARPRMPYGPRLR
ncbi:hypothetical protein H4582DRAFT_2071756 [Lactarius indigo]|nr:hypothetical protein H4582DRAFT_2071756 [Lactarius indigo]